MPKKLVIIPTYNELENVSGIIKSVFSLNEDFNVLIVDDNSPDGTADIVKNLQDTFNDNLFLLERKEKNGLGAAYISGFKWALKNNYDYIFEMDADFSHPVYSLSELYEACAKQGNDMSVGSRYIKGGEIKNWSQKRLLLSKYASIYVRIILGLKVKDTTAGFVCYNNKLLSSIDLDKIWFVGYAFQIEMKYTAQKLGFKLTEVPIIFKDREKGVSKMSMKIFKEAIWGVIRLRFKNIKPKT